MYKHTLFLMFFALLAYMRVLRVSMKSLSLGLMQAIISVRLCVVVVVVVVVVGEEDKGG